MQHLRDALRPIQKEAKAYLCCPNGTTLREGPGSSTDEELLALAPTSCDCCGQLEDLWVRRRVASVYTPAYASVHREDLEKLLDCWEEHHERPL